MSNHRFQHLLLAEPPAAIAAVPPGFMPCPVAVLAALSSEQQSAVEAIYRIARARVRRQIRPESAWPSRVPFSRN